MNFDLGPDELALQQGIRELCSGLFPSGRLREGFDRAAFRRLGEAGVFSLRLPESEGGVGLGWTQAVVVYEELGRALVPGPLVGTQLAAGRVDGAATGELVTGVADGALVEHLESLDALLVWDGTGLCVADPPAGRPVDRPLDPLTPLHRVERLDGSRPLAGTGRAWLEGAALTAALSGGIAARTTEMAVAYAKEREQFGRPIGSFQAVKHLCADMLVRAEVARAAVEAAGCLLDDPEAGELERAVRGAKLLCSEAGVANGKACVQVHGGMGFTWEVDVHLYLKRAALLAVRFGSPDVHAAALYPA